MQLADLQRPLLPFGARGALEIKNIDPTIAHILIASRVQLVIYIYCPVCPPLYPYPLWPSHFDRPIKSVKRIRIYVRSLSSSGIWKVMQCVMGGVRGGGDTCSGSYSSEEDDYYRRMRRDYWLTGFLFKKRGWGGGGSSGLQNWFGWRLGWYDFEHTIFWRI